MAGVYVHIPFCASRCSYCDFFSTLELKDAGFSYVEAVIAEAALRRGELGGEPVRTLYLGGGTPSQLPLPLLSQLVDGLRKALDLTHVEEFTIEANPDDVTPEWSAALPSMGVNRVSMGVQTFEDDILRLIGRRHTAAQVVQAITNLRSAGISNISIDLIYGLPGQTLASWIHTVEQAIALRPQHVSAYGLTYEEGTRLWRQRERGEVAEVPEEVCVEMYRELVERLQEASFEHYEISNFALPGYHSRHNSSYWDETPYLGLGAAAHSYDGSIRRSNPCDLHQYIARIQAGEPACEQEEMTSYERYDERVMLGLRTAAGIDAERLREDYGEEVWSHFLREIQRHLDAGHVRLAGKSRYVLTADGILLSDSVIRDLMW
ncbi:MAG: radical SAM family heme chaperone HemW [Muribaculaceae bacterium]|nr:radical SAM family heme chaperone HemW [Muribaculaceae bacterium]MBR5673527.1 radical SAM family heme chaperone HemW [Muribaculaceae bacterium]